MRLSEIFFSIFFVGLLSFGVWSAQREGSNLDQTKAKPEPTQKVVKMQPNPNPWVTTVSQVEQQKPSKPVQKSYAKKFAIACYKEVLSEKLNVTKEEAVSLCVCVGKKAPQKMDIDEKFAFPVQRVMIRYIHAKATNPKFKQNPMMAQVGLGLAIKRFADKHGTDNRQLTLASDQYIQTFKACKS